MGRFPTPIEDIVLDIAFELMGESRINRGHKKYMEIAARLPPLKKLHGQINDRLREMAVADTAPSEICPFKKGDQHIWYKPFPTRRHELLKHGRDGPQAEVTIAHHDESLALTSGLIVHRHGPISSRIEFRTGLRC